MPWLIILVAYCIVCWVAAAYLIRLPVLEGQEEMQTRLSHVRIGLILLAPILTPLVVYRLLPSHVQLWRSRRWLGTLRAVNRSVREYEFIPVDGSSLEEPVREHLETLTPPLEELGFQLIGDFRMKPKPVVVYDRIFFSPDGRTLATICCLLEAGAVSLISVLDDGTCVHTTTSANPHPERTFEPADQLALTYAPGRHPINLHREHQQAVSAAARTGAQALQLQRDQFRAVMVYDQRIFNRWRYRHGGLDQEPPAPDFASLVTA